MSLSAILLICVCVDDVSKSHEAPDVLRREVNRTTTQLGRDFNHDDDDGDDEDCDDDDGGDGDDADKDCGPKISQKKRDDDVDERTIACLSVTAVNFSFDG